MILTMPSIRITKAASTNTRDVEDPFGLLDEIAEARRRAEVLAHDRAHHGKAYRRVQRREHPGQRRWPIDVPHQLPLAHAKHSRVRQYRRADFLDALVDIEEDNKKNERDAQRDLRPDAETEPKREDRRQHHARKCIYR